MSEIEEWQDGVFNETRQITLTALYERRKMNPEFTPEKLEQLLQTEYVNEGNDWVGRGALYELKQAATIAAYELFLAQWKEEREEEKLVFFKGKDTDRWFESQGEEMVRDLGIEPGWTVLDIGCGIGSYCIPLSRAVGESGRVIAVDASDKALRAVRKKLDELGYQAENLELRKTDKQPRYAWIDDNALDALWVFDVLQYITNWGALLGEARRMLRAKGRFCVNPSEIMHAGKVDPREFIEKAAGYGFEQIDSREIDLMHYKKMGRDRVYVLELH